MEKKEMFSQGYSEKTIRALWGVKRQGWGNTENDQVGSSR